MNTVLSLGIILLGGLAIEKVVSRLNIPAITSYMVLGIFLGPTFMDLAGEGVIGASELISHIVLGIIAFQIGSNFYLENFRRIGKTVVSISIFETTGSWLLVTVGIYYFAAQPLYIALIYGAISAATAPAATMMVIRQYRAKGVFTDMLLGVVAIDDAWGIIAFSISLLIAVNLVAGGLGEIGMFHVIMNVGGHIIFSIALGAIMAFLLYKAGAYIRRKGDTLTLILGALLISTGIALYFDLSPLLANMSFGAVLVNIDKRAFRFFDFIKSIDWPLYILFYVLVGVNLKIELLSALGLIASVYIIFRIVGKISGAYIGGFIGGAESGVRKYMGIALMPQAGVALGLALSARSNFPQIGEAMFAAITASTIVYELFGPLATRYALFRVGDARKKATIS